jgi:hypothetical protein
LFPVAGTALVVTFGSRALGHKWPAAVGLISYPLYLWHWPLLTFAAMEGLTSKPMTLTVLAASVVLATLTTKLVENPIRFGYLRPRGVGISLCAMILVAGFSAIVWRCGGLPQRYPVQIQKVLATLNYEPGSNARVFECWLDNKSPFDRYSPECSRGATLVWGDSHAARLYAGLTGDGIDIAQFTRNGCPATSTATYEICAKSNAAILQKIAELKPRAVILFGAWALHEQFLHDDPHDEELVSVLIELKKIVENVVLVGQAPFWSPDLPTQVYAYWRINGVLPDRLPPRPLPYAKINNALAAMAATAQVRFVSPFAALCNEQGCCTHTPESRSELISWDYGHPTQAGARYMASLLQLK